jgi:flagellar protein FliO/FliZ
MNKKLMRCVNNFFILLCAKCLHANICSSASDGSMIGQTMLLVGGTLIGVLTLIGLAARLFQMGVWQSRPVMGRTLILRESVALDPRRRVHVLQCGERQVVLLTGGGQDLVVGWIPEP